MRANRRRGPSRSIVSPPAARQGKRLGKTRREKLTRNRVTLFTRFKHSEPGCQWYLRPHRLPLQRGRAQSVALAILLSTTHPPLYITSSLRHQLSVYGHCLGALETANAIFFSLLFSPYDPRGWETIDRFRLRVTDWARPLHKNIWGWDFLAEQKAQDGFECNFFRICL